MKYAISLIILWLILPVSAGEMLASQPGRPRQFTGTYVGRSGDWKILNLGGGKLKVACSLTYVYKVRGLLTAHTGEGSGEATLTGATAVFKPRATSACTITLRFAGNKLVVKQEGSDADCGFGHNVYASGTYRKRSGRPPRFETENDR